MLRRVIDPQGTAAADHARARMILVRRADGVQTYRDPRMDAVRRARAYGCECVPACPIGPDGAVQCESADAEHLSALVRAVDSDQLATEARRLWAAEQRYGTDRPAA